MFELLLFIFVEISLILLIVLVYRNAPDQKINRIFAKFFFFIALWCIPNYLENEFVTLSVSSFLLKLDFALAPFIFYYYLLFCINFPIPRNLKISAKLLILFPIFIISPLSFTTLLINNISLTDTGIQFRGTPLLILYGLILFVYAMLGSMILICKIKKYDGIKKTQLYYVFLGISITAAIALIVNLVLSQLFVLPTLILRMGIYCLIIVAGFMAYAIFRHNLLDIRIVFRKGLIYSSLIAIITTFYVIVAMLIENIFRGFFRYKSLPITLLATSIVVLTFQPLKNRIQRFIDRYFFRGSIDQIDQENTKLRDELQKSEKMKAVATLAAGMAHEIKNPLTSIKTFTEYIDKKQNDPDFINKFKEVVGPEVDRINHIVKQLLEFSKPSELELKDTNINQLLNETLDLLNNNLISRNIKIEKHLNDLPIIKVDPNQLKQVFLNLFLNAIEAINHNGTITVTTKPINSFNTTYDIPHTTYKPALNICIHDNGCGINKADIPKLFDPFYTNKDSGTGLGLSVVHGIIEKHNGTINVLSKINEGTEFVIKL